MNIGIVTTWFERGAAYVSRAYMDVLSEKHQVYIYARGGEIQAKGDPIWDLPNVTWAKTYPMPNTRTYMDEGDFSKWLEKNRIDVVFFNEQSWWQSIVLCKRLGIKTGAYIDYYTDRTMPLFNIYDFLICNTKRHYSAFSWHKQCYYVPWGTDTDLFSPGTESPSAAVANKGLVFYHSAGMSPFRKGTDYVIEAFNNVALKHADCRLIIHTQANLKTAFPPLVPLIDKLIDENRLELIIRTVGAPGLYHKGDVYLYPSRLEGIGLTMAEALSCGLPVVTVDNQPMNEFIAKPSRVAHVKKFYCRGDGYYWPMCEVDIDCFAEQMQHYLSHKSMIGEYKKSSREYALKYLNWSDRSYELDKIFSKAHKSSLMKQDVAAINTYDNSSFPMISKYPKLYSGMYRLVKILKQVLR
ncbi:MAG: glycosyltransferase family 4 protein [Hyphomicrobiales bacterium]|nr:glycosyltransferase family 4 protein [Hyphomicrobiales bacterium]